MAEWYFPRANLSISGRLREIQEIENDDFTDVLIRLVHPDDFPDQESVRLSRKARESSEFLEKLEDLVGEDVRFPVCLQPWSDGSGVSIVAGPDQLSQIEKISLDFESAIEEFVDHGADEAA